MTVLAADLDARVLGRDAVPALDAHEPRRDIERLARVARFRTLRGFRRRVVEQPHAPQASSKRARGSRLVALAAAQWQGSFVLQDDYFMRLVTRAARAIALALFHKQQGETEEAQAEIDDVLKELLGPNYPLFDSVDLDTLARMLGSDPAVMRTVAHACRVHAELLDVGGSEPTLARRRLIQSIGLFERARAIDGEDSPELAVAVQMLDARSV
jgi:hypothetical protein